MPVTINGTTGVSAIQDGTVTSAKIVDGTVTPADLAQVLTLGTAQNTTSGTSIDFTGIPSWVKRITFSFSTLSSNGLSLFQLRVGSLSGGIESTGYFGSITDGVGNVATPTTGIPISPSVAAAYTYNGFITLVLMNSATNLWAISGTFGRSDAASSGCLGYTKSLSSTLDRIRLTTVNGTDTFDAGSANIMWE